MSYSKEDVLSKARHDLARRLGVNERDVREGSVEETDFPDTSLGAGTEDEMSGQMLTRVAAVIHCAVTHGVGTPPGTNGHAATT